VEQILSITSPTETCVYQGNLQWKVCTEFLTESVTRAGHEELPTIDGISKSEFASYLGAAK